MNEMAGTPAADADLPWQAAHARERGGKVPGTKADFPPRREVLASRHVAYLTNVYPKISHSFIKTEIAGIERLGFSVARYTVRRAEEALDDSMDRAEAERTTVLLDGIVLLAGAVASCFANRPLASLRALALSWRVAGPGNRLRACAYFAEAALLARLLESRGVTHVHAHFGTNPAMVARLVARMAPVTYSFTVHGPDEFDAPERLDLRGKIAEAAFVAGVSSFGRGQLMRWSDPADWERLHVVRCAPARTFLEDSGRCEGPGETNRFLCVARLSAQKGLPLLIEAVAQVAARRAIALDIIGGGEDHAAIAAQIARLGLAGTVRLLGWGTPEAIRQRLETARGLVLPSFAEGLPVVLMEAMALRRPVICTAIAGVPELVDDSVGWLVPSGSVAALVEALDAALDAAPEALRIKGEQGRLRVLERHAPERCAAELAALLIPLIEVG